MDYLKRTAKVVFSERKLSSLARNAHLGAYAGQGQDGTREAGVRRQKRMVGGWRSNPQQGYAYKGIEKFTLLPNFGSRELQFCQAIQLPVVRASRKMMAGRPATRPKPMLAGAIQKMRIKYLLVNINEKAKINRRIRSF